MTWIRTISLEESDGRLRALYNRIKGKRDAVDNIMLAHSLRPHTMEGHMTLYKNVLHHARNTIEEWFLEAIGVYTSWLNACHYCVEHHAAGMSRLVGDPQRASRLREALESGRFSPTFDDAQAAALVYARTLTREAASIRAADIEALRSAGWDDGEILEINQVVAYFNYANRTVLGLGVTTDGDVLGLSPGATTDPNDWTHA